MLKILLWLPLSLRVKPSPYEGPQFSSGPFDFTFSSPPLLSLSPASLVLRCSLHTQSCFHLRTLALSSTWNILPGYLHGPILTSFKSLLKCSLSGKSPLTTLIYFEPLYPLLPPSPPSRFAFYVHSTCHLLTHHIAYLSCVLIHSSSAYMGKTVNTY